MGYAFNRSFFELLTRNFTSEGGKDCPSAFFHGDNSDWAISVKQALLQCLPLHLRRRLIGVADGGLGEHSNEAVATVTVFQPTVSRVWHRGAISAVGNKDRHAQVKDSPPWQTWMKEIYAGELLDSKPILQEGLFNYLGFPCSKPHAMKTNVTNDFVDKDVGQEVLDLHPNPWMLAKWLGTSVQVRRLVLSLVLIK